MVVCGTMVVPRVENGTTGDGAAVWNASVDVIGPGIWTRGVGIRTTGTGAGSGKVETGVGTGAIVGEACPRWRICPLETYENRACNPS